MGLGIGLSGLINITALTQLLPIFAMLSGVSIAATYRSVAVIDETHFNNQRAHLLFENYFESGVLKSVKEVNQLETFYSPNFINF